MTDQRGWVVILIQLLWYIGASQGVKGNLTGQVMTSNQTNITTMMIESGWDIWK